MFICDAPNCANGGSSPEGFVNIYLSNFLSFSVNGTAVSLPNVVQVSEVGSFVDGAAQNTFSGTWQVGGNFTPRSAVVFFREQGVPSSSARISDVLYFNEFLTTNPRVAELDGYFISDANEVLLSRLDLNALGIFATQNRPETGLPYRFGGAALSAGFQSDAIPEPQTWAMMLIGFAGLGYAGLRFGRKTAAIA